MTAHQNLRLLVHDLLRLAEVTRAIAAGDWGRIEDMLGELAMMFRGAGSNNYCTEILHFIHNLKKVWGEDFAYVSLIIQLPVTTLIIVQKECHARQYASQYDWCRRQVYGSGY